jgi:heme exporter protein A
LIATPAPIWLLDEPAATLDRDGEDRLVAAIAEHRRSGGQAVIATHQPIAVPDADTLVMDEFAVAPEFAIEQLW